jgi:hypothetical protein
VQPSDFFHPREQLLKELFHVGIGIGGGSAWNLAICAHRIGPDLPQGVPEQCFAIPPRDKLLDHNVTLGRKFLSHLP